jgi:hypothetical protein
VEEPRIEKIENNQEPELNEYKYQFKRMNDDLSAFDQSANAPNELSRITFK